MDFKPTSQLASLPNYGEISMNCQNRLAAACCITIVLFSVVVTGCISPTQGPTIPIPIPVTPYMQQKHEDNFWNKERYDRMPILGPLQPGAPEVALDPPSDDEVMQALEKARPVQGGMPLLHEISRNNVRIRKEKIADYVDPPRFYPLIGPAQLHHAHYKCTVNFTEVTRVGWPIPHTLVDKDTQEVIYIDHNHFHMVGDVDPGKNTKF